VVGLAVDEEELAVVVDAAKIAGVEPAVVAGAGFGVTEVPLEHGVGVPRPDHDLARLSVGKRRAGVVDDAQLEAGLRPADEPGLAGRRASPSWPASPRSGRELGRRAMTADNPPG